MNMIRFALSCGSSLSATVSQIHVINARAHVYAQLQSWTKADELDITTVCLNQLYAGSNSQLLRRRQCQLYWVLIMSSHWVGSHTMKRSDELINFKLKFKHLKMASTCFKFPDIPNSKNLCNCCSMKWWSTMHWQVNYHCMQIIWYTCLVSVDNNSDFSSVAEGNDIAKMFCMWWTLWLRL